MKRLIALILFTLWPTIIFAGDALQVKSISSAWIDQTRSPDVTGWMIQFQDDGGGNVFLQIYDNENVASVGEQTGSANLAIAVSPNSQTVAIQQGDTIWTSFSDQSGASREARFCLPAISEATTLYPDTDFRLFTDTGRTAPALAWSPTPSPTLAPPTPSPSPTPTIAPATPTPSPAPSATPTPLPSATPSPAPSATASPIPSVSPTPVGYETPAPSPTPASQSSSGAIIRRRNVNREKYNGL